MYRKRKYILGILALVCLIIFTGCSVRKNVKNKEVKEFTKSILESNNKIKDLNGITIEPSIDIKTEYSKGKIITTIDRSDIENIVSTEFRYKTYFLDQYIDVERLAQIFNISGYKDKDTYHIREHLLLGQKDFIEIEVAIIYNDGKQQLVENTIVHHIKEKIYNDFVIKPEIAEDKVYYHANGLTAIIHKESYDEEILFYSNPNDIHPNISVGFEKDYALYSLNSYEVISKPEAAERNYEGFTKIDFQKDLDVDNFYILIEYGMIALDWEGFYPYDLDGNEVFYTSKDGSLNMVKDGKMVEISDAAHEKHKQMKDRFPDIEFRITK